MAARQIPFRPRKSTPRVRTGCKTCKIRRVKCDEKKPECFKCTSTGRKCDGYSENSNQIQKYNQGANPGSFLLQRTISPLEGLGESAQYLAFYHCRARIALSTKFNYEFWSRVTLQMAHSEPAIRHALIALGYLYKTETGTLKSARCGLLTPNSQKPLLVHYNKALTMLVDRINEPSYSPEIGLVACLLFICIEQLRGNQTTAFSHLQSGLKLLADWQKQHSIGHPVRGDRFVMIRDSVMPIFVHLLSTAMTWGSPVDRLFTISLPSKVHFTNLLDAHQLLRQIQNIAILHMRHVGIKPFKCMPTTPEDFEFQEEVLECHRAWFRNLEALELVDEEDKVAASALKVGYYTTYIYLSCAPFEDEMTYDDHLYSFQALNRHAGLVIDYMNSKTSKDAPGARFAFDMSVLAPLYLTACRCRCPVTRRESVALLLRNNLLREGLWDAESMAAVAKRAIEVEESELDPLTGWPPKHTRLWNIMVRYDMDENGFFTAAFEGGTWFQGEPFRPNGDGRTWIERFFV